MRRAASLVLGALLLASPAAGLSAQERDSVARLVFPAHPWGSQAVFSPLSVLWNKGYDHFQVRSDPRDVWSFPYRRSFEGGALDALLHPRRAVEAHPGWGAWLRTEVLPLNFTSSDGRWFVNWTEHLIGGGMTYRQLGEWYALRGWPAPRVWAGLTTFAASLMNETIEHRDADRASSSTVADLWLFDLGGILLFNWDPLVRFFAGTLQFADWSHQAALTFPNGELQNNGQYYVLKIPLGLERTRLFARGGMGVQVGLSRRVDERHSLTASLGLDTEVRTVDPLTRQESIGMAPGAGLFWDRDNSLLASLTVSPAENLLALNVYPGLLPDTWADLGLWAVYTRTGEVAVGVVHRRAAGLGVGLGW